MIEKNGGVYSLTCDICGESVVCDSFDEAVDYKKDNDWKSQKRKGEWEDVCWDCQD